MDIIYFCQDEVHLSLAADLALGCGATIRGIDPGEAPPDGPRPDAALYDLDAVSPERRAEVLTRLVSEAWGLPTAVHGYRISDRQAEVLRRRGVAVSQRLGPELLWALSRAARRRQATIPPDDAQTEETWINLDP